MNKSADVKIPDRFLDAIGNDSGNCVLFVGAGLSKKGVRRGGAGIPDWDELMQLMIKYLEDAGRYDETKTEQLRAMLKEDPPRYLDVAEEFWKAHIHDLGGYERFLRRHLDPSDLIESEIHKLIFNIGFRGVVSYNFDLVFEKLDDHRWIPVVYPDLMDQIDHIQRGGFFAKIHGCISRPANSLILTRSSYEKLRLHQNYRDLIFTVLFAHKVLCVGFSLRDPDFQSILQELKNRWESRFPPLYALMRDPGESARSEWLTRGIDILPYADHHQLKDFFQELAGLPPKRHYHARKPVDRGGPKHRPGLTRRNKDERQPKGMDSEAADIAALLVEWQAAPKIEEMDRILSDHLQRLPTVESKEALLFRLGALCEPRQAPHLCRQLIVLQTPTCDEFVLKILAAAAEDDYLNALKPHRLNVSIHRWVMEQQDWTFHSRLHDKIKVPIKGATQAVRVFGTFAHFEFHGRRLMRLCKWLLEEAWGAEGINLWTTFLSILTRIKSNPGRHGLDDLYVVAQHIPGASAEIEKVVFAKDFVREDDLQLRWFKSGDEQIVQSVQFEKFAKSLAAATRSPGELLTEAFALEASLPKNVYRPYTDTVVQRLLDEFVQRTHLTVHSSSDIYDPTKAREILEALAALRIPQQQLTILWAINQWPERMRGLGSLGEDSESLRTGLFIPLWWRYSSEARIEYLCQHHRGHSPYPDRTGQEFLLEDIMGLHYDIDKDFRETFDRSLDAYRDPTEPGRYEPRPLQEIWRDRQLTYQLLDECPPELVRRVAIRRVDWENLQPGSVRWAEAKERAQRLFTERQNLHEYVSSERGDYVIDNLLGAYFPARREIVLYVQMIRYAATELGLDEDALATVVYIHETTHAFSHLGRDLSGRMWDGFALPLADVPDAQPNKPHEAIAQCYTFKLLERLDDRRLLAAFSTLEQNSDPVYRAWRQTENYSLEAMREVLVRYRTRGSDWPPNH